MNTGNNRTWPDPRSSVGDYRGTTQFKRGMVATIKHCWEAENSSPASNALRELVPQINELLEASGNRVPDSSMILMDIFMIGNSKQNPEESVPYIMFGCPDSCKGARRDALRLVKRSGLLKKYPGLKASHWEYPPDLPGLDLTAGIPDRTVGPGMVSHRDQGPREKGENALQIYMHKTNPDSNSSLLAQNGSTIGAKVRFGDVSLFITSAHMLLPLSHSGSVTAPQQQQQPFDGHQNDLREGMSEDFSDSDSTTDGSQSEFDDENLDVTSSGHSSDLGSSRSGTQSPSLFSSIESRNIPLQVQDVGHAGTQQPPPAFENLGNQVFFACRELDFAILDLSKLEMPTCNLPELRSTSISTIAAGNTEVEAQTGSGRMLRGRLSGRSSYIRFPYGNCYQEVYPVHFSTDVQLGDSGALVRDSQTRGIYGHVVAASIQSRTAFIVPATEVMRSISRLIFPTMGLQPIYAPLDNHPRGFRITRLLPGSPGDPIRCEQLPVRFGAWLQYEVLSCIVDQQANSPVLMNNQPWKVGESLAAALRRLRYEDRERCLWIDSLCINPANEDERRHQYSLVPGIIAEAEGCMIWLGDVEKDFELSFSPCSSQETVQHLQNTNSQLALSPQDASLAFDLLMSLGDIDYSPMVKQTGESKYLGLPFSSESQQALGKLMGFAWWKKFQVVQEAVFSRTATLVCGPLMMDLNKLGEHVFKLRAHLEQITWPLWNHDLDFKTLIPFMQTIERLHRFRRVKIPTDSVFILNAFRDLEGMDPRDKLLMILNMCNEKEHFDIINAGLSLPTNEFYKLITSTQLRSRRSLFPLMRIEEHGRSPSLPTWVPDWSATVRGRWHIHSDLCSLMSWKLFNASSDKDSVIHPATHGGIWTLLPLRGVLVGEVLETYNLMEPGLDLLEIQKKMEAAVAGTRMKPEALRREITRPQGTPATNREGSPIGNAPQEFWRLLTCDIRVDEGDGMCWRRACPSDRKSCEDEYRAGILGYGVSGKRLFSTSQGNFGLGPAGLEIGDVIAVLFGGRFPFILRRKEGNMNRFALVGYAYVQGIMDGEAVSGSEEGRIITIV